MTVPSGPTVERPPRVSSDELVATAAASALPIRARRRETLEESMVHIIAESAS